MAADLVRIGVLGTGTIVRDYHLPVLKENDRAEVVAAGNLRKPSLSALAREWGIPRIYTDFEEMARDPDLDAVVIALPNYLHAPVTVQMLRAGKHVLCEKPMAMTVAEGQLMVDAADESGMKLMIAHMWRYDGEVGWLRDVIASGVLGRIFKVKAQNVSLVDLPPAESWFVQPEYAGGGALADMAIHAIDLVSSLFHDNIEAVRLFAQMGTYLRDIKVEDTGNIMIEYDNGMVAMIESGWYHPAADGPEGSVQVFGTKGYGQTFPTFMECRIEGVWGKYHPEMPSRLQACDLPMYASQMDHFIDCVLGLEEPVPDGRQGLKSMAVLEAAYASVRTGASVRM